MARRKIQDDEDTRDLDVVSRDDEDEADEAAAEKKEMAAFRQLLQSEADEQETERDEQDARVRQSIKDAEPDYGIPEFKRGGIVKPRGRIAPKPGAAVAVAKRPGRGEPVTVAAKPRGKPVAVVARAAPVNPYHKGGGVPSRGHYSK